MNTAYNLILHRLSDIFADKRILMFFQASIATGSEKLETKFKHVFLKSRLNAKLGYTSSDRFVYGFTYYFHGSRVSKV